MDVEPLSKREEVFYFIVTGFRKTFRLMGNIRIIYQGTEWSKTNDHELECFVNSSNEIFISIETHSFPASYICLDEHTAIKLSKELRKEIAILKQNKGGDNG